MKFVICHDIPWRLRIRVLQSREMTCSEADTLKYALSALSGVSKVSVQRRTAGVTVCYGRDRAELMVDFSCALKLAMPISVLSAIREANGHRITVKGGKFLEALAEADTIVFDKTGTLTEAKPVVASVVPFLGDEPDELLRTAACLEEHFPHSMARAVVEAAGQKDLEHSEMHSRVEYTFQDEQCTIPEGMQERFDSLPAEYSHLYMAVDSVLAAVICIEDPLREEAADAVSALRKCGIKKIVMMTGDSERTARAIAEKVGVVCGRCGYCGQRRGGNCKGDCGHYDRCK